MRLSPQRGGHICPPKKKLSIGVQLICAFLAIAGVRVQGAEQGQTRIQSYTVNTKIEKRFARTKVAVDFVNEKDCATVIGFTMHLPINARVTALSVDTSSECEMEGEVKALKRAQEEFDALAAEGKPAAIVQSWDTVRYPVWVSLPPTSANDTTVSTTRVEIDLEELLHRRNDRIAFQVPLSPGLAVESLVMDVTISEPESGIGNFDMDSIARGAMQITRYDTTRATAHLELDNVLSGNELDRLIHGTYDYDPASIPSDGLIFASRTCVAHLFNPSQSLLDQGGYMPRNIVFVIDVSGSMRGQKLRDAKTAFDNIIQTLTKNDYLTIHTFSTRGTESVWGPSQATSYARSDASSFVDRLQVSGSTNLYEAFGDGLTKVRSMQARNAEGSAQYVPIVVVLTDGQATTGPTSGREIARVVRNLNEDIGAKMFALAFGEGADLPLLLGICIQNGGKAVQIYEGYGDSSEQMEEFYNGEIGDILLADVNVALIADDAGADIGYQTQTKFPVFPSGSEIFVRARTLDESTFEGLFRVVTTATSATSVNGPNQWTAEIDMNDASVMPYNRECLQSFAHEKVAEILSFRDAAKSLGDDLLDYEPYPTDIAFSRSTGGNIVATAEARALELALEAQLVWPGLTAMVTVENEACAEMFAEGNKVCTDGDGLDGEGGDGHDDVDGEGWATAEPMSADIGAPAPQAGGSAGSNGGGNNGGYTSSYPDYDATGESGSNGRYSYNSSWSTQLSMFVNAISLVSVVLFGLI